MKAVYIGIYVVVIYSLVIASLYWFQEKLIFQGSSLSQDYQFDINVPFEEVYLKAEDAAVLHGVLLKCANPKGAILYFHGNRGNISRWGNLAAYFSRFDYDVLVMDYRGYGKSKGKRTEQILHADATLAYQYLETKYEPENIIIYGRSLGTGIATRLASTVESKSLILETPYDDFGAMMFKRMGVLPSRKLFRYQFRSNSYIGRVSCPVFIFHGTEDNIVPIEYGRKLAGSVNRGLLSLTVIEGGEHNNLGTFDAYNNKMKQIFSNQN